MLDELIGSDIAIDEQGNFIPAPDGDVEMISGYECLIQEIKNEMNTEPGDLFYDLDYGYGLLDFVQKVNDEITRLEYTQRIRNKLSRHELVDPNTVKVDISEWDLKCIKTKVSFKAADKEIELDVTVTDRVQVEVVNV